MEDAALKTLSRPQLPGLEGLKCGKIQMNFGNEKSEDKSLKILGGKEWE